MGLSNAEARDWALLYARLNFDIFTNDTQFEPLMKYRLRSAAQLCLCEC